MHRLFEIGALLLISSSGHLDINTTNPYNGYVTYVPFRLVVTCYFSFYKLWCIPSSKFKITCFFSNRIFVFMTIFFCEKMLHPRLFIPICSALKSLFGQTFCSLENIFFSCDFFPTSSLLDNRMFWWWQDWIWEGWKGALVRRRPYFCQAANYNWLFCTKVFWAAFFTYSLTLYSFGERIFWRKSCS